MLESKNRSLTVRKTGFFGPKPTKELHRRDTPVSDDSILTTAARASLAGGSLDLLVLDTQPVARAGAIALLSGMTGSRVPRQADSAAAAWSMLEVSRPDLVVLELNLNGPSGLDFIRQAVERYPDLKILVLSAYPEAWYAVRALRAGAMGYVMKSAESAMLLSAVRRVAAGQIHVSAAVTDLIVSQLHDLGKGRTDHTSCLSDREFEVFLLIGQALGTSEIARRLRVSVSSVESYRAGIKRKLGLNNCTQLVHAAVSCAVAGTKPADL